jgi:uncharacterized phage protein (TIGR02218 family)
MRTLSPALQAHLDTGETTLCLCWRLTLKAGEVMGFTDHDLALDFDGTVFEAQAGFSASEIETALGLAVDNLEAKGALTSGKLDELRLRAGDFDHAQIEIWKVNWADVTQRMLERKGHLGEVSSGGGAFTAEVRGLAHVLNQEKGRIFTYGCDAMLGDARCGVTVAQAAFQATATVLGLTDEILQVTSLAGFSEDWFARGTVEWVSGENAGRSLAVKRHRNSLGQSQITLWTTPGFAVTAGELLRLTVGCDKQFQTCRERFANAVNYRGFPHMPGSDFVMRFAANGGTSTDGSRMRH